MSASDPTLDPNLNMGECISLLTTGDNYFNKGAGGKGYAVHVCDYLLENYPDDFYVSYAYEEGVRRRHSLDALSDPLPPRWLRPAWRKPSNHRCSLHGRL